MATASVAGRCRLFTGQAPLWEAGLTHYDRGEAEVKRICDRYPKLLPAWQKRGSRYDLSSAAFNISV
jgi:hypothetical protein